jgi:hypothetical protein
MDNPDVSIQEVAKPLSSAQSSSEQQSTGPNKSVMFVVVFFVLAIIIWFLLADSANTTETIKPVSAVDIIEVTTAPPKEDITQLEVEVEKELTPVAPPVALEPVEELVSSLPTLDESDSWLQMKLPELTWRTELLQLVIDEDMIRRFVVFTDNFAEGNIAYEHSPFILPKTRFTVGDKQENENNQAQTWQWNETTTKRFSTYVDLLRSVDSANLVDWYFEAKPLVDQAYNELGYDNDFTLILQDAITRVLDMELPKSDMSLTRPSVMYKYQDADLENLDDSEKLLLRLGKENLLIIKSVLLEINEKLAKQRNGIK